MMNKRAPRCSDEEWRQTMLADRVRVRKLVIKMVLLKKLFKKVRGICLPGRFYNRKFAVIDYFCNLHAAGN